MSNIFSSLRLTYVEEHCNDFFHGLTVKQIPIPIGLYKKVPINRFRSQKLCLFSGIAIEVGVRVCKKS